MNIQTNTNIQTRTRVQVLTEAFQKHKTVGGFLLECGDNEDNRDLYEQLALNESFSEESRFTFENGMFLPGLGSRAKGRLSLNSIAAKANSAEAFVEAVNEQLTKPKLDFELTEADRTALLEAYQVTLNS